MFMGYAKAFGLDPEKVFSCTNQDTVFAYCVDLHRTGYYSDVYNEIERLNTVPPDSTE